MERCDLLFPVHLWEDRGQTLIRVLIKSSHTKQNKHIISSRCYHLTEYCMTGHFVFNITFCILLHNVTQQTCVCVCWRVTVRDTETQSQSDIQSGLFPCFSARCHPAPIFASLPRGSPETVQASESCAEERELASEVANKPKSKQNKYLMRDRSLENTNRCAKHWILTVCCVAVKWSCISFWYKNVCIYVIVIIHSIHSSVKQYKQWLEKLAKSVFWCDTNYKLTDLYLVTSTLREETCCWTVFKECLL